ncbi:helix-turn-helix domain-containing protein [Frankia tisae]|uniref:helix-turn-helix domain-containing protein n=1 Tax=Frankia tisae TaxID=2950104 RepID=UPI0021BF6E28|nr:helix-turn-helix domain-containing protein [Frankia tisae]
MPVDDPDPRRTQRQRRASSRELILDAAVQGLFEDGYARTTTVAIQTRAGVSRGRLLHHFPSREDLLVAAGHRRRAGRPRHRAAVGDLPGGVLLGGDGAVDSGPHRHRSCPTLAAAERQLGGAINSVVATMYGPVLSAHPDFPAARALIFISMRGVAVTYAVTGRNPRADPHLALWKRVLREMLTAPAG